MEPDFLSIEDVLLIHDDQIELYGGRRGVRDLGLLDSAVAMPRSQFGGSYLHEDIFEQAAAYLFHIAQNHPFIDGNKRAAAVTALLFLDINGIQITVPRGVIYELTMGVAQGQLDKAAIADFFKKHAH